MKSINPTLALILGPRSFLSSVVAAGFAVALAGCGEKGESPTAPSVGSTVEAATTAATVSFTRVSAGGLHTCGLTSGGQVYAGATTTTVSSAMGPIAPVRCRPGP